MEFPHNTPNGGLGDQRVVLQSQGSGNQGPLGRHSGLQKLGWPRGWNWMLRVCCRSTRSALSAFWVLRVPLPFVCVWEGRAKRVDLRRPLFPKSGNAAAGRIAHNDT